MFSRTISGNIGSRYNNEDIVHYPEKGSRERGSLRHIDNVVQNLINPNGDYVFLCSDVSKLRLDYMSDLYIRYPEYFLKIINELLEEDDTEMQAFAAIIIYYIKTAESKSRRITFRTVLEDIYTLMIRDDIYFYSDIYNRISLIDEKIDEKGPLEDDLFFERACAFEEGFMEEINKLIEIHRTLFDSLSRSIQGLARESDRSV